MSTSPGNIVVSAAGQTDPGRRDDNEDAFGEFPRSRLFVVADGMGGRAAGGAAASLAVRELERFFREQQAAPRRPWPYPMDRSLSFGTNLLAVGFKLANQQIREAAATNRAYHRMGATAAALAVGETQVVVAHVGDVRVYRLRDGQLTALTQDHSVVEEVRAARPEMTETELAAIANRNVVTRALGTREEVEAAVATHPLQPGDLYLLCTDGLWGAVTGDQLRAILTDIQNNRQIDPGNDGGSLLGQAARRLIDAARVTGEDNITALLVQVNPAGDAANADHEG